MNHFSPKDETAHLMNIKLLQVSFPSHDRLSIYLEEMSEFKVSFRSFRETVMPEENIYSHQLCMPKKTLFMLVHKLLF